MKRNKRWIAAALVVMMFFQMIPAEVLAADVGTISPESVIAETEEKLALGDNITTGDSSAADNTIEKSGTTEGEDKGTADEAVTPEMPEEVETPEEESKTQEEEVPGKEPGIQEETPEEEPDTQEETLEAEPEIQENEPELPDAIPEGQTENKETAEDTQSVAAQLQARIDALPGTEVWNRLCEQQNGEYAAIHAEINALCKEIKDTYGLDLEADTFDPSADYSAQCPLDLAKLTALLYAETMESLQIADLPVADSAFDQMCQDIFGVGAAQMVNNDAYAEVYVGYNSGGEHTGTPGTPEKPYGSLEAAYNGVAGKSGVIIHLMESYKDVQGGISTWPVTDIPSIIISDAYDSAFLQMAAPSWDLKANTGFYNVQVNLTYAPDTTSAIYANGKTLVFGGYQKKNFAFRNDAADRYYPALFGAGGRHSGTSSQHSQVLDTNLKVYGGTWSQIFGGGEIYSDVTGTARLTVDGSYPSVDGELQSGAVTFVNTHLSYMEGSSNVYGGGAGNFTLMSSSAQSNVNNAVVRLAYLTTEKYVTPCGGWMGTSASITLDHVNARGVNARSEGKAAERVDLMIKDSKIKERVGALGSNNGGDVNKAYIYANQITDFNITIEGSTVDTVAVKSGDLGVESHNNSVTGVDLIIKNSEVTNTLAMAQLPAEYSKGTVDLIHLENSNIKKYGSSANFGEIKTIKLINMPDLEWKDYLFSANYNEANKVSETLYLEGTNVHFKIPYQTEEFHVSGGKVILDPDLTFQAKSYYGGEGSEFEMHDGSSIKFSGTVSGTGTTVVPVLVRENSDVQIVWKRAEGSDNLEFFKADSSDSITEKKAYVSTMNMCHWGNYELEENTYIYVDGKNGYDSIGEYNNPACTEDTLGYHPNFPVKTLGKAYDLCKNQEEKIVVCGPYEIPVLEKDQELLLINCEQKKDFPVTITSTDDLFDYREQGYIKFLGTEQSGRLDLQEELIFDNIDLVTDLPKDSNMRIFSNGYKTVYGAGVSAKRTQEGRIELYGGAYQAGVASTDLSVQALNINRVSAGGYGEGTFVGNDKNTDVNKEVVAKLNVNLKNQHSSHLYVDFSGIAYGSVQQTFKFDEGSSANLYFYYQQNYKTIYGDFITEVSSEKTGGTSYACISPEGQDVKGTVQFTDSGNNFYRYMYLKKGTYQDVDINIASNIGDLNLFDKATNAEKVEWKLSGNVATVSGINENEFLNKGTMQLNVELDATGNTVIKAGTGADTDPSTTGYSQKENVSITLKNFGISDTINSLQGFGSVTFENCQCLVNTALYTKNLSVQDSSKIQCMQEVMVGQQDNPGKLSLLDKGYLVVNNKLILKGDMVGAEKKETSGTLENNWVNAQDETEEITINGTVTGLIYYATSYESASIRVTGETKGTEYMAISPMSISCTPSKGEGSKENRVWTVTNPVSKKVIFVDGTVDMKDSSYGSHDGSSPERAYATLEEGYEAVLNGGTIVICGDTTVPSWPKSPKAVTITSKMRVGTGNNAVSYDFFSGEKTAYFSITNRNIELKNDTVFEYLNIKNKEKITIGASGNKLIMGHDGDDKSLVMSDQPLNVGGGTNTTKIAEGINADVTIYAGTYGTVSGTNSFENTGNETRYLSVRLQIFGGVFDKIYIKGNLYDHFDKDKMKTSPMLTVENATVKTSIHAMECDYTLGNMPYQITIGKDMVFADNAMIVAGTYRANYGTKLSVKLDIDGSGGKEYTIPVISTGKSLNGGNIKDSSSEISIKGATVGKFYSAIGSNTNISARELHTELSLYENATIDKLYFGGTNTAGKESIVNVYSSSAKINAIFSGSENNPTEIPETAELNFIGSAQEKDYVLSAGISLDGLTKVTVQECNLDLTGAGPDMKLGTLDVSKGDLTYRKNVLNLQGDYVGGSSENPTTFYGWKAPNFTIEGTVSGVTQMRSLALDPSASDNQITGKFYYGILIKASHSAAHKETNFQCLQQGEDDKLSFTDMSFTPGTEDQMDQWEKENEEDQTKRTEIYVSTEEGVDNNLGTYVSPVKTIGQAYSYADQLYKESLDTENHKTALDIVLIDDVTFDGTMPEDLSAGYTVTIKSENEEETATLGISDDFHIPVDTIFDNIIIKSKLTSGYTEIFANGHTVICSDKLKVEAENRHYPILYGGSAGKALSETNLEVYGGTWNQIFGGSKNAAVTSSNLTVGGNVDALHIGTADEESTGVFGGGKDGTTGKVQLTVEGGSYYRIFGGGMNPSAKTGNITVDFHSGETERLYGGGQYAEATEEILVNIGKVNAEAVKKDAKATITDVYRGSGLYAGLAAGNAAVTNVYENAVISENAQFAAGGYSGTLDTTKLSIHGGMIRCDVYAGGWGEGTEGNYGTVREKSSIVVDGGTITGSIYGGGNLAVVKNDAETAASEVQILGGNITGNIYGGGNAAGVNVSNVTVSSDVTGNVFGGSKEITSDSLQIQKKSNVVLNTCTIVGSVFGGSDTSGWIKDAVHVETRGNVIVTGKGNGIYGGGSKAPLQIEPTVTVPADSRVTGNIYGGGKGEAEGLLGKAAHFFASIAAWFQTEPFYNIEGLTDANVPSTKVVIQGTVTGNVYGGGEMATVGSSESNTWSKDVTHITLEEGASVTGNIYGGGKGQSGKDYAVVYGNTKVELNGGSVKVESDEENTKTAGAVFGGSEVAPVAGNTGVTVQKGTFSNLFGGNDVEGEIRGETSVNLLSGSNAEIAHVYGGGRDAAHGNTNHVTVHAGTVTEVYGGGYGTGANSLGTNVTILGGTVSSAYGGGNAAPTEQAKVSIEGGTVVTAYAGGNAATVTKTAEVVVNTADDEQHVQDVFAGNNAAAMTIQPTLTLTKGKIGSVYCGGNAGVMDVKDGLKYDFDYPGIQVETVYAGCNNTLTEDQAQAGTSDVELNLISGQYDTVYGGNNVNGYVENSHITVAKGDSKTLNVKTVYGGGNQADAKNTKVTLINGKVETIYGGGNNATVMGSVTIESTGNSENPVVTDLYCGNNAAGMSIAPVVDFDGITIENFYGGGNKGRMTAPEINYSLSGDHTNITTAYGGCNQADVTGKVILNLAGAKVGTAYGGCNTSGVMTESVVNVTGGAGTVYGGGKGENTTVTTTQVNLQNGTVSGSVYGGSGEGKVETSHVTAREEGDNARVAVKGDVFGAGYGQSSSVTNAKVTIDLNLNITVDKDNSSADVLVSETPKETDSTSGESSATATWLAEKSYTDGSYIQGNVFGGGDMGQIGSGFINNSTNTAVIQSEGSTAVTVSGGYVHGNVFGGGNGQPSGSTDYNTYMGTVFGTSRVYITGGYVNGNLFGCGQQSRTYAASNQENDESGQDASYVNVEEGSMPTLIGGSIFGGGNKGNGNTQNASVATVYGDTHVNIVGKEGTYTQIYMLSDGNTGGGVYGDGNLCLVSGKKYVTMKDFSCGKENTNLLKTFYSLQRADRVDVIGSRIVLKGAVDLVAENVDDTKYSINRVGQLNMKESSTVKLVQTVNLLAELTSDEQPDRQFINRGNNNGNAHVTGNNYTAHGGSEPSNPLAADEAEAYIKAYESYYGTAGSGKLPKESPYQSINVVCVANGGYLEVKKNAAEYGAVTGLYTLQLLNAVPGEGGGFVYASIDGKKVSENTYATGNFVCVTKDGEASDEYMIAYHDVGGHYDNSSKQYEYYLWYLRGNKYNYDVDLTGFIGTTDTEFSKTISLPVETEKKELMLATLTQEREIQGLDLEETWKNTWADSDDASDKIALKLELVKNVRKDNAIETETSSIGYIGYQTDDSKPNGKMVKENDKPIWGIWRKVNNQWKFQASELTGENQTSMKIDEGDTLGSIGGEDVVNAQLYFTLYKGTGMTTEFKNLPFEMMIAEVDAADYITQKNVALDSCIRLIDAIRLSAIRLVPTQAAYIGSGRLFAGVSSSTNVDITKTSAFTAQFVTKYIPSAFNTGTENKIQETLVTSYHDTYLVDENGVGYKIQENEDGSIVILNKTNVSDPSVTDYSISKTDGKYTVTYTKNGEGDAAPETETYSCTATERKGGFTIPKGTVITLLASLDDADATYWYYYCEENTTEIPLEAFRQMNTTETTKGGATVYDTIFSTSSSRVTENMIFVFDFSNVKSSEWSDIPLAGDIMLKHTYNGTYDIMEYVSSEKQSDDSIQYIHETPKATSTFEFSPNSDGIESFVVSNAQDESADEPTYYQNDTMDFTLNINPDTSTTNTIYEEREYAVILTLKQGDEKIPFPEGTTASYNGKQLIAGTENEYFIVPVKTVGAHQVTVSTGLRGLAAGDYSLEGALYSTSATGYYNSIAVTHAKDHYTAPFHVQANPEYALKVEEGKGTGVRNHLAKPGQSFSFMVTAKAEGGGKNIGTSSVQVNLYRYHASGSEQGKYQKISLDTIFEGMPDLSETKNTWNPKVVQDAEAGTCRLEFAYKDKTEYWDFIIQ